MYRYSALLLAALFTACASGGIKEQPAELPAVMPAIANLDVQWWHILGDDSSKVSFGQLYPTVVGEDVFVPLASGEVYEVNVAGKARQVGYFADGIAAPLATDGNQFALLTGKGKLVVTDRAFNTVWELPLNALASAQALMSPDRIFVQTIDGRINAIERTTGRLLWAYQDAEPNLSITGTSQPVRIETGNGAAVVSGLANGKVVALSVLDGSVIWEYRIARASGKTDVSQLVDVDAKVTVLGDLVIATGYQGDLVVIDSTSGRVRQAQSFSSYRSIQPDGERWFGVNAQSHIVAFDVATLTEVWVNEEFEYRQISELAIVDDYLFAADAKGFLFVLDKSTGEWLGSRHIDWRGSNSNPVLYRDGVLLQGVSTRIKYLTVSLN